MKPACTTRDHEALKADPARWARLPRVGEPTFFHAGQLGDDVWGDHWLELRNCACGSTLGLEIPAETVRVAS